MAKPISLNKMMEFIGLRPLNAYQNKLYKLLKNQKKPISVISSRKG
jgi:hypothetical protein